MVETKAKAADDKGSFLFRWTLHAHCIFLFRIE